MDFGQYSESHEVINNRLANITWWRIVDKLKRDVRFVGINHG
jgi:hypothetical protein